MNVPSPALRDRADALSRAVAAGDEAAVHQCLLDLAPLAEGQWCATLAAVVERLNRDLETLPSGTLLARTDLPDASQRLDHVVRLTEQAAHQTLDCIETGQHIAETLARHPDPAVRSQAAELRRALRDAAAAQAYQDVTGQLLGQVIAVLGRLRGALDTLVADAGIATREPAMGPVLPGSNATTSQGDADRLLSELGL